MAEEEKWMPVSLRDPDGQVFRVGSDIYRSVVYRRRDEFERLINARWFQEQVEFGNIVSTSIDAADISPDRTENQGYFVLRHRTIELPIYPHEICAAQLYESGMLTLNIAEVALENGWLLKDASAWNVLYDGSKPCFVDISSFVPFKGEAIWHAYGQFIRHYLLPLMLYRYSGLQPKDFFVTGRDGVFPDTAWNVLPVRAHLRPSVFEAVTLPRLAKILGGKPAWNSHQASGKRDPMPISRVDGARVLLMTIRRLRAYLKGNSPALCRHGSTWSDYEANRDHYRDEVIQRKARSVEALLTKVRPSRVLDLGCNAGEFSLMAAETGASVVAVDFDEGALTKLYRRSQAINADITCMLLDLGRPTPAVGWRNAEVDSVLVRLAKKFDCILALGLVHHLLVTERIPLREICDLFSELTRNWLIVEFIPNTDAKFIEIAKTNIDLYQFVTRDEFEKEFGACFEILHAEELEVGGRAIYLMRVKGGC